MGHYRSEMGYEAEDKRRAEEAAKRKATITKNIEKDIEKRGVAAVLTDILMDPGMYRISMDR